MLETRSRSDPSSSQVHENTGEVKRPDTFVLSFQVVKEPIFSCTFDCATYCTHATLVRDIITFIVTCRLCFCHIADG